MFQIVTMSASGVLLCQMKEGKLSTKKITVTLKSPVQAVLTEAASFCSAPEERIQLTYQGRILNKADKLDVYPVADGGLIMAVEIPEPKQKSKPKAVKKTPEEIRKFCSSFKTCLKSPAFPKVIKRLLEKENMDNLSAACPGLEDDSLAQAFLTKPDLLSHLCSPEVLTKLAESHPCLVEAANNLAAAVHEEQQAAGRAGAAAERDAIAGAAAGGGSYYLDEMSDDDMDTEDSQQRPQRSRSFTGGITAAQLAQALSMASGMGGGVTGMGVTGAGPSSGGGGGQQQPSSGSGRGITSNMFQAAMQQALMSAGMGGAAAAGPGPAAEQGAGEGDGLAAKVERMREMGIVDEGLAIQALQIMGGDLQAAVDLIFSGWEGGDEAMS